MPFDPDEFLKKTGGFDPDEFLKTTSPSAPTVYGAPGSYSAPSVQTGQGYGEKMSQDISDIARESVSRQEEGASAIGSNITGGMKSMNAIVRNLPGVREVGEVAGNLFQKTLTPLDKKILSKAGSVYEENVPAEAKNILEGVAATAELAGSTMGAARAGSVIGKNIKKGAGKLAGKIKGKPVDYKQAIEEGFSKGVKPRFTADKKSIAGMNRYAKKGEDAVSTIIERKDRLNLVDDMGEPIALPQTNKQFVDAIEQTKRQVYDEFNALSEQATGKGISFNSTPIRKKLAALAKDGGKPDDLRAYAADIYNRVQDLDGLTPAQIQERIKYYNQSLGDFYSGRGTTRVKAEVDASVAAAMRKELDDMIENAGGMGYQELKNKYGALRSIEDDVNHRAMQLAKSADKSFVDLTDVFTGSEIAHGVMTLNPALVAKGAAGKGIKEYYKWLNKPDRYIKNMFEFADTKLTPKMNMSNLMTKETPVVAGLPERTVTPAYFRKGIDPLARNEQMITKRTAERAALEAKRAAESSAVPDAIRGMRPRITPGQEKLNAMKRWQLGLPPQ